MLRAIGDLNGTVTTPGWISWLSPIGWGQEMRAFGVSQWWPLAILILGAILLCGLALRVEARRDLGTGVLPDHPGPSVAGRFMQHPFGLAVRLQRGTLLGWLSSTIVMAILYGSVASAMVNLLGTNPYSPKSSVGKAIPSPTASSGYWSCSTRS